MQFDAGVKRRHACLAEANRAFLEYVESHPECLERSSFVGLERNLDLVGYPLQPWPLFVDVAAVRKIDRAVVGLTRLLKSVPERFFDNDPETLAAYYGQEESVAKLCATLLGRADFLKTLLARGDFFESEAGLQCLEVNLSSNSGGWESLVSESLYLETPPLAAFLRETGLRIATRNTICILVEHLVEHASRLGLGGGSELNLLFAIPADEFDLPVLRENVGRIWSHFLQESHGLAGEVLVARLEEIENHSDELYLKGRRVHIVVEQCRGRVQREVLFAFLAGNVLLINGTVTRILDDRRNLALLSEYQDSEYFDEEERRLIREHVPWTRVATRDYTDYCGERSLLPTVLLEGQERLVLKHVYSYGGEQLFLGAVTPPPVWEAAVDLALAEEGFWVVQELVHPLPCWRQRGASGCAPHDVVWGAFAIGDRYGGGFLRMKPSGTPAVVNSAQGAEESLIFEVLT